MKLHYLICFNCHIHNLLNNLSQTHQCLTLLGIERKSIFKEKSSLFIRPNRSKIIIIKNLDDNPLQNWGNKLWSKWSNKSTNKKFILSNHDSITIPFRINNMWEGQKRESLKGASWTIMYYTLADFWGSLKNPFQSSNINWKRNLLRTEIKVLH